MTEPTAAQFRATIADMQEMIDALQGQLRAEVNKRENTEKKLTETTKRLNENVLANTFSQIANTMGFPPESIPDVVSSIQASGWAVSKKGVPEFRDKKSGSVFYDVEPEQWLREQAGPGGRWHYLARQGHQVGADRSGRAGQDMPTGGRNPWSKDGWDDMAQAAAYLADPQRAEAMAKAAGSRIGALRPA